MLTHADYSVIDRQTTLPASVARRLSYDAGFALGLRAGVGNELDLAGLLVDARVLSTRHASVAEAARLMHVHADGLRGFLDGAGRPGGGARS